MPKSSSIQVVGNIFACLWDGVIAFPVHCPIGRSLDLAPSCIRISPEKHKGGRMVDYRKHKPHFLCFRADSGNFSVLVGQTVISLPSSETEPTSRKPVGARRCCPQWVHVHSLCHKEGAAHPHQLRVLIWGCPAPSLATWHLWQALLIPMPEPCPAPRVPASPPLPRTAVTPDLTPRETALEAGVAPGSREGLF